MVDLGLAFMRIIDVLLCELLMFLEEFF